MKIFVAHSSYYDFQNELYKPLRNSELSIQHDIFLPQENGYEEVTKERIKDADLFVADISYPSTGQGIELGWADIFEIPIVCIYKKGSKTSKSLKKITNSFIEYENPDDMVTKLSDVLRNCSFQRPEPIQK